MNRNLFLILGLTILLSSCDKEGIPGENPKCIEIKINEIKDGPVWNPPAKVYSYRFNAQTVYYIPQRCCDIPSELYDENCTFICSPDGRITGNGDGQCPDFFTERTDEKLIWEDGRE